MMRPGSPTLRLFGFWILVVIIVGGCGAVTRDTPLDKPENALLIAGIAGVFIVVLVLVAFLVTSFRRVSPSFRGAVVGFIFRKQQTPLSSEPPEDAFGPLCRSLSGQLGPFGYQWLCACAVFPVLDLALTIHLGERLAKAANRSVPNDAELLAICSLPWFRKGWMPEELRERLVPDVADRFEHTVREAIAQFVFSALETGSNSGSKTGLLHLVTLSRGWQEALKSKIEVGSADTGPDSIFLSFATRSGGDYSHLRNTVSNSRALAKLREIVDQRSILLFSFATILSASIWFSPNLVTAFRLTAGSPSPERAQPSPTPHIEPSRPGKVGPDPTPSTSLPQVKEVVPSTPLPPPDNAGPGSISPAPLSPAQNVKEQPAPPERRFLARVCVGEFERECQQHNVFLYCGENVEAWARPRCSSPSIQLISTKAGNRCGYSLFEVSCTGQREP